MTFDELKKDTVELQKALRFAGMYDGRIDGICGPKTIAGVNQWERLHRELAERYGEFDYRSESNIYTLQPQCAQIARQVLGALRADGTDWRIIHGVRSYAEQDALYAKGRTKPGAKVTNAKGGQSRHNFGIAFDVCLFKSGKDIWEPSSGANSIYKMFGQLVDNLKSTWGGHWTNPYDPGHAQLTMRNGVNTDFIKNAYSGTNPQPLKNLI